MIQSQTILRVSDNSGARTVKCIKVLGGFKRQYAKLGDIIVVSVQKLRNRSRKTSKVKKKEIYRAIIIWTKSWLKRKDGYRIKLCENAVVLLNNSGRPIATRVMGGIHKTLRGKKNQRLITISAGMFW